MRWGILWRSLGLSVEKVSLIVSCCIKLHNFILEKREDGEEANLQFENVAEHSKGVQAFHEAFCSQDLCDTETHLRRRRQDLEKSTLRDSITARIKELKLRRPRS